MFDLNFIAEPGIQTESSEASWSFLHKRKKTEAISRGASRVVFVEKNRRVFKVLQKNLQLLEENNWDLFLTDSMQ